MENKKQNMRAHTSALSDINTSEKIERYVNNISTYELKELKLYLDDIYYNTGESSIDDWKYDIIKERILTIDPSYIPEIGAKVRDDIVSIELPYYMGSLDKVKYGDINSLKLWMNRNMKETPNYVIITDKLDGVSCLLEYKTERLPHSKGNYRQLYTRGDGNKGSDVSFLLDYINYIPDLYGKDLVVRGEIVISTRNYRKYSTIYKNSRNMVSGIINAKTIKPGIETLDFIAYEIVSGEGDSLFPNPQKQLSILKSLDFRVVKYSLLGVGEKNKNMGVYEEKQLKKINEYLSKKLIERREKSIYNIDGLVIYADYEYERCIERNPKYAFSFKENQIGITTVEDVIWEESRTGFLKPKVKVKAIEFISGVTVNYVTGHNGKFILDNNIGPGTIINITRSGEVIPHIVSVIEATEAKLPNVPYHLNETGVEFIPEETGDLTAIKKIEYFFKTLDIKNISIGIITRLYNNGYTTIKSIIEAHPNDIMKLPNFKKTLSEKIYNNILEGLKCIPVYKLMVASGEFDRGIGENKMELLCREINNIHVDYKGLEEEVLIERITSIKGFSTKTAKIIVKGLPKFEAFYNTVKKNIKLSEMGYKKVNKEELANKVKGEVKGNLNTNTNFKSLSIPDKHSGPNVSPRNIISSSSPINGPTSPKKSIEGKKVVFTGFRNIDLENLIKMSGGTVTTTVSKNTNILIYSEKSDQGSSKFVKALELGIDIMSKDDFITKYI